MRLLWGGVMGGVWTQLQHTDKLAQFTFIGTNSQFTSGNSSVARVKRRKSLKPAKQSDKVEKSTGDRQKGCQGGRSAVKITGTPHVLRQTSLNHQGKLFIHKANVFDTAFRPSFSLP